MALALLVLVAVSAVELWSIIAVASAVGVLPTLLLMGAMALLGLWLVRRQGLAVMRRVQAELAAGRMPAAALLDGLLVLAGGLLLVAPGFVSDAVGLLLLVPPVRSVLRPVLLRALERRARRRGGRLVVIDTVTTSSWGTTRTTRSPWGTVIGGSVVDAASAPVDHAEVVDVQVDEPRELPRPERPAS